MSLELAAKISIAVAVLAFPTTINSHLGLAWHTFAQVALVLLVAVDAVAIVTSTKQAAGRSGQ